MLLLTTVLSCAALLSPAVGEGERAANVLVLLADDLAIEGIGALGNDEIRTPQLDRLVERGTTFTHTYNMGSWAAAVCLPARSMLLSGRSLWRVDFELEGIVTWPECLRNQGFATFASGKWHNSIESFERAFTHGGHIFFGAMADDHGAVPVNRFRRRGGYPPFGFPKKAFSTELFAEDAIAFLETYDGKEPFFAYVAFMAPHDPFQAPNPYGQMYDPEHLALPEGFLPVHPFDNGDIFARDERLAPMPRTPKIVRRHRAGYYAMMSHLDAQVGRILKALEASDHADDTLILFASDHGLSLGRHGLLGKQNLYEASLRAPAIFVGPGVEEGRRVDARCYLFDLFPTVLDYLGLELPEDLDGQSLLPWLEGERGPERETIYAAYLDVQRSVRDERYKLIRYTVRGRTRDQLFDLERDPHEEVDLAESDEHAATLARLAKELAAWQVRVGDPDAR